MTQKNKNPEKVVENSILVVDNTTSNVEAEKKAADEKKAAEKAEKAYKAAENTTYIMKVTHLAWGANNQNHFNAYNKPVISRKVMGRRHGKIIDVWLEAGHVEKGEY